MALQQSPPGAGFQMPASPGMAAVTRITALSRATLYRRIADGRFPPPIHLGGLACGWTRASLQTWIDDPLGVRPRLGGRQRRPTGVGCDETQLISTVSNFSRARLGSLGRGRY